jgi:hypothetical protein
MGETVKVNGKPIAILSRGQVEVLRNDALLRYARDLHDALGIEVALPKHHEPLVDHVMDRLEQLAGPFKQAERYCPPKEMCVVKGIPILDQYHLKQIGPERAKRMAFDIRDVLGLTEPVPTHYEEIIHFILSKQRILQPDGPANPADRRGVGPPGIPKDAEGCETAAQELGPERTAEQLRNFQIMSRDQLSKMRDDVKVRLARHLHDTLKLPKAEHPPVHSEKVVDWILEKQKLLDPTRYLGAQDQGGSLQKGFFEQTLGGKEFKPTIKINPGNRVVNRDGNSLG